MCLYCLYTALPMRLLFLLAVIVMIAPSVSAQKQNNNWCFGKKGGVNFNTATPTSFLSNMDVSEGGSSISDRTTGQLLFHTNGVVVWDKTGAVMPNGTGVGTDNIHSCQQGCVIVPHPGNPRMYYIFTLNDNSTAGDLAYSLVDMSLNGGNGDVVSGQKKIVLTTGMTEGMAVYTGCSDNSWVVVFERSVSRFHAYAISATGVSTTPVTSTVTYPAQVRDISGIKIAPNGKLLAHAIYRSTVAPVKSFVTIHDFDASTGVISNTRIIGLQNFSTDNYYSPEFSPDASKLYTSSFGRKAIYQFDLTTPTAAAISASKSVIANSNSNIGDLQLGPDGNIYISYMSSSFLGRITNPNLLSPGAVVVQNAVALAVGSSAELSLPQQVADLVQSTGDENSNTDTTFCKGESIMLQAPAGRALYTWNTGATGAAFLAANKGTYWVSSTRMCKKYTDTFTLSETDLSFNLGNDTSICTGTSFKLEPSFTASGISFLWNDNSTSSSYTVKNSGQYFVTVAKDACTASDTLNVTIDSTAMFKLSNDTAICKGHEYMLAGPEGLTYKWNTGSKSQNITVKNSGIYWLVAQSSTCRHSDSIIVKVDDPYFTLGNDTLVCNGKAVELQISSLANSSYRWFDSDTQQDKKITAPGIYYGTAENKCGIFSDTIAVNYEECDCEPIVPSAFTPNGDGHNDYLKPLLRCNVLKYHMMIANRRGQIVFNSADPGARWDGKTKGADSGIDTYFYYIQVTFTNGQRHTKEGDFILIR